MFLFFLQLDSDNRNTCGRNINKCAHLRRCGMYKFILYADQNLLVKY